MGLVVSWTPDQGCLLSTTIMVNSAECIVKGLDMKTLEQNSDSD